MNEARKRRKAKQARSLLGSKPPSRRPRARPEPLPAYHLQNADGHASSGDESSSGTAGKGASTGKQTARRRSWCIDLR